MIEFYSVAKEYHGRRVLKDVTFQVGRGEFVFLTGPSGAGKSTLLKMLFRAERPTSGQILVNGMNVGIMPHGRVPEAREVVVKIAARHDQKEALALLGREISPMSTGGVVGMTGSFGAGRVSPSPVIRMFSCLVPKSMVPVTVDVDGHKIAMQEGARSGGFTPAQLPAEAPAAAPLPADDTATVPLIALAYGRSGDKGDNANIGIFARRPEYEPILDAEVTEEAVARYFAHRIEGPVTRWRLPGIKGFNFLLRKALGGGGMASLKADPLAKAFAQMLLDMPVRVPRSMAAELDF